MIPIMNAENVSVLESFVVLLFGSLDFEVFL